MHQARLILAREFPVEVSFAEDICIGSHFFTGIIRDVTDRQRAEVSKVWSVSFAGDRSNKRESERRRNGRGHRWCKLPVRKQGKVFKEERGRASSANVFGETKGMGARRKG
jgi:hypothetical protein